MKWQGRRGSRNIEDRRTSGRSAGAAAGLGGVGVLLVLLWGLFTGQDVTPLLQDALDGGTGTGGTAELTAQEEAAGQFVSVTLADTEEVWTEIFRDELGRSYDAPVLVLFRGQTQSQCGGASAATGPFYCPPERKVFLDTDFFATLERQLGAGGDFAAAYVVAHEVGHHVQNELGILDQVNRERALSDEARSNALSVRVELQADCLAGVWARRAALRFQSIEKGDIAEAMNAAAQIGDDRLQRSAGQVEQPELFTHGTSDQRQRWFERGFAAGRIEDCDTFSARSL